MSSSSAAQQHESAVTFSIPEMDSTSLRIRSLAEDSSSSGGGHDGKEKENMEEEEVTAVQETMDPAWIGMEREVCAAAQVYCMDTFIKKRQSFSIKGMHLFTTMLLANLFFHLM